MRRASPLRAKAPSKPRKALPRLGRKGKEWETTRARLKVRFAAVGITRCEMCGRDDTLGFAHRLKRRNITTLKELETVALLCAEHHDSLEIRPEHVMGAVIDGIIDSRETPI